MHPARRSLRCLGVVVLSSAALCGCSTDPRTDAERLARGRELVQKMSSTLERVGAGYQVVVLR